MALKDLIADYDENEQDIIKWTTLKESYRYIKMIKFMKKNKLSLDWQNVTNYMKYDKRILYNSFKYIVVLEELFKSLIAKNSTYKEEELLTMDFKAALSKLLSLNKIIEFDGINFDIMKKEQGAINSFRNAVAHNKMLLERKYIGSEEFKKNIPGKNLQEILEIYKQIIPESYRKGFISDMYKSSINLYIENRFIYFEKDYLELNE